MKLNKKLLLVSLLYFAEGFPFGIIEQTLPVYFRIHGMSLVHVGLLSLLTLPYVLKFIWAPAVDFLGTRRRWISAAQFLMAAFLVLILPLNPAEPAFLLWVCILSLAIMSATQDVAVDAYTIELLKPSEMGIANGFRMAAYRVAMVVAGGLFVALGGRIGWQPTFLIAAIILAVCSAVALKLPPVEVKRPQFSLSSLAAPVKDLWMKAGPGSGCALHPFVQTWRHGIGTYGTPLLVRQGSFHRRNRADHRHIRDPGRHCRRACRRSVHGSVRYFSRPVVSRDVAGCEQPHLRVGCLLSGNRQLGDLRSLDCGVVLRRTGHCSVLGFFDEHMQKRILRDSICIAFCNLQNYRDYCGRAEWLGCNPYRLRTVFLPHLFSLASGVRISLLCQGLDSYRPECVQFREELRCAAEARLSNT